MGKIDRWADYLPADELETYRKAAFGNPIGYGKRAALLNVDTTNMFVDPAYPLCGAEDPARTGVGEFCVGQEVVTHDGCSVGVMVPGARNKCVRPHPTLRTACRRTCHAPRRWRG